jgi:mono/diheme cytochrome c family protein
VTRSLALAAFLLAACSSKPKPGPPAPADAAPEILANAAHGAELVAAKQCNRCHEGTGHPAAEPNKHCVQCHANIVGDRFQATPALLAKWKPRVKDLADAPSLESTGKRFRRSWVEKYLLLPTDLRPELHMSMPRLDLSVQDARDIAAYLVPSADAMDAAVAGADLGKGRQLLEAKGCTSCHAFTGVAPLAASAPPPMDAREFARGRKLAPDLRFARDRMTAASMRAWIADPREIKSDTVMPKVALTANEVRDLAGYIHDVEIRPPPPKPPVARLPLLTRPVTFKEVDEKVFHRTCWHCHSEPDYAIGDGGPGNSGGLGFKPRGLNLSDYKGIAAGFLDEKGERTSVFAKDASGMPRLVRAMLARHDEEHGAETGPVRGMPLGYDPLPLEDIQLVDSWIAQGRPK